MPAASAVEPTEHTEPTAPLAAAEGDDEGTRRAAHTAKEEAPAAATATAAAAAAADPATAAAAAGATTPTASSTTTTQCGAGLCIQIQRYECTADELEAVGLVHAVGGDGGGKDADSKRADAAGPDPSAASAFGAQLDEAEAEELDEESAAVLNDFARLVIGETQAQWAQESLQAGQRVSVLWPPDGQHYGGLVLDLPPVGADGAPLVVLYDTGEVEAGVYLTRLDVPR